jgi:hypothetical protein
VSDSTVRILDDWIREQDFYPGSKQRRGPGRAPEPEASPFAGVTPKVYTVSGQKIDFFNIGQLAAALERKPVTLRKWEQTGVIPRATFQAPNPKGDPRARRRLYTRDQAEGIVRIAREEHLIGAVVPPRQVGSTQFTKRVFTLFKDLQGAK